MRSRPTPKTPLHNLSPAELSLLAETEEEWMRAAQTGFRCIFPPVSTQAHKQLMGLFERHGYADALIAAFCCRPVSTRREQLRQALTAVSVSATDGDATTSTLLC